MRMLIGMTLLLPAAVIGCANALDSDSEAASDVVGQRAALIQSACTERKGELPMFAMYAANLATEAMGQFDADNHNELAVRYFGEYFDAGTVGNRIQQIMALGRSSRVSYECHDVTDAECAENETRAFYCPDEKCGHYSNADGWTLNVCGDRFWTDPNINGQYDGDMSATQYGVMVHEMSHLAGAYSDLYTLDEYKLTESVKTDWVSRDSVNYADAYRQYVMHSQ